MADRQARELTEILQRAQSLVERMSPAPSTNAVTTTVGVGNTINAVGIARTQTSTTSTSGNILGNYRRLFAPYPSRPSVSSSSHQRGSRASKASKRKKETWTHEFFCLGSVVHSFPPNPRQKIQLQEAGLGRKKIAFECSSDAAYFQGRLEEYFPKLKDAGGIEILRSQGRLEALKTIVPPRSGYSVTFLKDLSSLGMAVAYIRPIQKDLDMTPVAPIVPQDLGGSGSADAAPYMVQCFLCGKSYPLDEIRGHRENCFVNTPETTAAISDSDDEDPQIDCEICSMQIKFSSYNDHMRSCAEKDECLMLPEASSSSSPSHPNSFNRIASNQSNQEAGSERSAETSVAAAESKPSDLQQLINLTQLSEEHCERFLNVFHEGDLSSAVDDFVDRGTLGLLLSSLSAKQTGPNKYLKVSTSEEAFAAAFSYFKGPLYKEANPIAIESGPAIDAGGPMRQFFEDALKVIISGKCIKIFEGSQRRMAPVNSSATVMSGVLQTVGRICAHSLIQGGLPFKYLSPTVYWFLVTESTDEAMQHSSHLDVVSPGVKYVIDKLLEADTEEKVASILRETESQIVLEENNWDRKEKVEINTKNILIQWLVTNDVVFKRKPAIESFAKGLEAVGLLSCMKENPKVFEKCFVWDNNDEEISNISVLEMLDIEMDKLDEKQSQIYTWFQDYILAMSPDELRDLLQFMTGCSTMPHAWLRQRSVQVKFHNGDAVYVSTCLQQITLPDCIESKEKLVASMKASVPSKGLEYNTW